MNLKGLSQNNIVIEEIKVGIHSYERIIGCESSLISNCGCVEGKDCSDYTTYDTKSTNRSLIDSLCAIVIVKQHYCMKLWFDYLSLENRDVITIDFLWEKEYMNHFHKPKFYITDFEQG